MKNSKQLFAFLLLLGFVNYSWAQTVVYTENYDSDTVETIINNFNGYVPNGASPCSMASRGNTSDFNSTTVDFKNTQNSSYFLGNNPESPCGGYNIAKLSDTMNWSGTDSLVLSFRYYQSTTLNWGPTTLSISFISSTSTYTIDTAVLLSKDAWTDYSTTLPTYLTKEDSVIIQIGMGGGEGVGLDDIVIMDYPVGTADIEKWSTSPVSIFPNPTKDWVNIKLDKIYSSLKINVYSVSGRRVFHQNYLNKKEIRFYLDEPAGIYFIEIPSDGQTVVRKLIKK